MIFKICIILLLVFVYLQILKKVILEKSLQWDEYVQFDLGLNRPKIEKQIKINNKKKRMW